jgi:amino acid transporter
VLAIWIAVAGMVSALALFNALLLSYSRVPFAIADDGYLPKPLARTDDNGTPRNAVLVSALVYSAFVLIPFGSLVVADVLLYSLALSLEFASLVMLRRREPTLRGVFRIPLGANAVTALAALPMLVLLLVIFLSFRDGEYGLPALIGTAVAIVLGPLTFYLSARLRPDTAIRASPTASLEPPL